MNALEVEDFIRRLYCRSAQISPGEFRQWALLQLVNLLDADAALWGTGNLATLEFHYLEHLGLDKQYGERLSQTLKFNPIRERVLANLDNPIAMSEVYPDSEFFSSKLYNDLFEPYGIKRILATGHRESDCGLYSLISLYRFDAEKDFQIREKQLMTRLVYHLVSAASHNFFLHLQNEDSHTVSALCDNHGVYWQCQPEFMEKLSQLAPETGQHFPFALEEGQEIIKQGLCLRIYAEGELYRLSINQSHPFDSLTQREQQIVAWIVKGLTFKEVARELDVAPSTISNHLYRIYRKLDITSRSELAKLSNQSR
ncbi:helix-turn-helix transcriptional regulator [Aliiglaciecola sp. CAU 1673]|uniref:helix-turn-helix domain-containing protein n=1 Tax=Aliiglaciecola sp. CAU 1673 TaxID=3032595 RepID=UPI0023DC56CE|nr:helix-turn-helix transcriptional regulator [Aliiglaciecola sp. CAU 1673]MDF2179303.1 helix-turn-helix transcriptional regulator [Aliiglaciecola sp. CAU 1673]